MTTPIVLSKTFSEGAWVAYHPQTSAEAVITSQEQQFVSNTQIESWNGIEKNAASYTDARIADLIGGAPETLDTLKEIADAIAAAEDVTGGLIAAIGEKAAKSFVEDQLALKANQAEVTAALALKADQAEVTAALATKADQAAVTTALGTKVDQTAYETAIGGINAALSTKLEAADVVSVKFGGEAPLEAAPGSIYLEVVKR